jgi:hypothetical protein
MLSVTRAQCPCVPIANRGPSSTLPLRNSTPEDMATAGRILTRRQFPASGWGRKRRWFRFRGRAPAPASAASPSSPPRCQRRNELTSAVRAGVEDLISRTFAPIADGAYVSGLRNVRISARTGLRRIGIIALKGMLFIGRSKMSVRSIEVKSGRGNTSGMPVMRNHERRPAIDYSVDGFCVRSVFLQGEQRLMSIFTYRAPPRAYVCQSLL